MNKTIDNVKESRECLKKAILQSIRDFEVANPDIEISVDIKRAYSAKEGEDSHTVNVTTYIK